MTTLSPSLLVKLRLLLKDCTRHDHVVLPMCGLLPGLKDHDMHFVACFALYLIQSNGRYGLDERETLRRLEEGTLEVIYSKTADMDKLMDKYIMALGKP